MKNAPHVWRSIHLMVVHPLAALLPIWPLRALHSWTASRAGYPPLRLTVEGNAVRLSRGSRTALIQRDDARGARDLAAILSGALGG